MSESFHDIAAALDSGSCLLLVHPDSERLREAAKSLSAESGWPFLSLGRLLSGELLLEPGLRRSRAARRQLEMLFDNAAPGPAVCADIDLLFEPSLELDPLALFRAAARRTKLVVAWPGSYHDDLLAYAVPEHAHYRSWRNPGVAIRVL